MTKMTVIALGVGGGPVWMLGPQSRDVPSGVATAVVVDGHVYLIDAGSGVGRQLTRAGLSIGDLSGVFITHMHSDHTVDLASILLYGIWGMEDSPTPRRVPIFGPADRGMLPIVSPRALRPPEPVAPDDPTPGIDGLFANLIRAYATDLNDRILDTLRPSPAECFEPRPIDIPAGSGYHPNDDPFAPIEPWEIFRDERVVVTATLVRHPPIAPAFAYRFDTAAGSVVISGDTAPCENLERIAQGATLLVHEAFDFTFIEDRHGPEETWDDATKSLVDHHHKSHTSPKEAVAIGARAGVTRVALNHLIPAIQSVERWHEAAEDDAVIVLQDLDVVTITDGRVETATG